jgi:hypothetical protein
VTKSLLHKLRGNCSSLRCPVKRLISSLFLENSFSSNIFLSLFIESASNFLIRSSKILIVASHFLNLAHSSNLICSFFVTSASKSHIFFLYSRDSMELLHFLEEEDELLSKLVRYLERIFRGSALYIT